MQRATRLWVSMAVLSTGWLCAATVPQAPAGEFQIGTHKFTLPDGFTIEEIAGPPLVDRPITADFDEQGRLYVSDSSGSNDKVEKQLEERPHRILRLVDTDGDGRFDTSTVFADKMMFPEGTMWFDGSLYVAAPPSIWKLTDTDGDGVCDKREEWFNGKTLTGCANDLHGPYAGPDGWIYWCKGAFAKQSYPREGQAPFETRAAHIFRCRPDGSGIEAVMTGGMDNPVDVVFTPGGERIFTTTFLQHPGGGKRDGLIHAVYGGVYGKVWDVIEDHPRTGDVLPPLVHLGAAAPCGLTRYEARVFGADYQDNIFACLFNMHKVTRHRLQPDGATFQAETSDFVVSDNLDFHPTDILEDADGSLVIMNTGGWYKLCCPTSQLHKPDILGAIYRVRRTGVEAVRDPRGNQIDWARSKPEELASLLADARPLVQQRSVRELARRGTAAVPVLAKVANVFTRPADKVGPLEQLARQSVVMRRNAVWALTRIDDNSARAALRNPTSKMVDPDVSVRQAVLHSISLWKDGQAADQLAYALQQDESLLVQRLAAEALGRTGKPSSVPVLLERARQLGAPADRFLEHALTFALIEIAVPQRTASLPNDATPAVRRVSLIAQDQMSGGGLDPLETAELLGHAEPVLRDTAAWIIGRHPEWGDALAGYFRKRLEPAKLVDAEAAELKGLLARFAGAKAIQDLLAAVLTDAKSSATSRGIVLAAMARSGQKEIPAPWLAPLIQSLSTRDPQQLALAVEVARALPAPKNPDPALTQVLLAVAAQDKTSAPVRLSALAAVPGGLAEVPPATYEFLYENLSPVLDVLQRSTAADVLARSKLTVEQLGKLTEALHTAGPLEADRILPAYKDATDEAVGLRLVASLIDSPALTGLRIDALRAALMKFPPAVQQAANEMYQLLNVDLSKQKEKLESLLASLKDGDVRRGQIVFNSTKAACAACHPFGYLGGNVGPDLTRIGGIRQERDLLEAIVFPSASFVRSFEPVVIVTRAGKAFNGLIRNETTTEIVLATGPREEARIPRDEIEELRPSSVSVMPSGLDQQLSPQDLADLIAFLKAAK